MNFSILCNNYPIELSLDKCPNNGYFEMLQLVSLGSKYTTAETQFSELCFSEHRFREILDLMYKLQLPFSVFYSLSRLNLVNRLDLVNKRGLTTRFTKSSTSQVYQYNPFTIYVKDVTVLKMKCIRNVKETMPNKFPWPSRIIRK